MSDHTSCRKEIHKLEAKLAEEQDEVERLREACIRKDYDYGLKIRHLREAVREIRGRALASMGRDIGKVEARARLDCIAKLARAALRGGGE